MVSNGVSNQVQTLKDCQDKCKENEDCVAVGYCVNCDKLCLLYKVRPIRTDPNGDANGDPFWQCYIYRQV